MIANHKNQELLRLQNSRIEMCATRLILPRHIRAMAIRARFGSRLVEEHQFPLNLTLQRVTHRASHIFVAAGERELRALVMIERGRGPALRGMAIRARSHARFCCHELSSMRVQVASFAILRRSLELNLMRPGDWFVTIGAGHRAMRSEQIKFRF